jgi:polysaccharide biosynthesis protein PslH
VNKPKILVFCTVSPLPVDRGDRIRLYQTIERLSQIASVRLLYIDRQWESIVNDFSKELPDVEFYPVKVTKLEVLWESLKAALTLRPAVAYRFITNDVKRAFQEQLDTYQPDLVWGIQIHCYPLLQYVKTAKKVVDIMDSVTLFYELADRYQKPTLSQQVMRGLQVNLAKYEKKIIQESDVFIACSDPNVQHLNSLHGDLTDMSIVYNRVGDEFLAQDGAWKFDDLTPPRLLFVGHLRYVPNNLAVRYIAEQILPALRDKLESFEFIICGKGHEQLQEEFKDVPNLVFKGFVEDLTAEYRNASVLISPVPYASGVQNKVIEAMALGLPVVIFSQTAVANEMAHGIEILACDTPVEFAEAIVKISTDRILAEQLSQAGSKLVRSRHTAESQLESFQRIIQDIAILNQKLD